MSQEPASIRQLISDVAKDAKRLIEVQAELAKAESKEAQQDAAKTGGAFAVAAVAGALGGIFVLVTIAWALVALGLPTWAGFGIVALVLLITAAIAGVIGRSQAKKINKFPATKAELERTKQVLTGAKPSTDLAAPAAALPAQQQA